MNSELKIYLSLIGAYLQKILEIIDKYLTLESITSGLMYELFKINLKLSKFYLNRFDNQDE